MRNKLIIIILFLSFCQLAQAQPPKVIDKVVAVVGNEAIFLSDIEELILGSKAEGSLPEGNSKCVFLEEIMKQKLLVAQAKLDSLKVDTDRADKQADDRIKYLLVNLGSEKAIEQYFSKTIAQIREVYLEQAKEMVYAQSMTHEITSKVTITPSEVEKFFKSIPQDSLPKMPDQYVIYQIVKKPNSTAAIIAAKQKLLEIRKRVLAGERFQSLATLYSEDRESARRGGEVGLAAIENWVPPIREALKNMRPGQVSQIVESEYGYHIVQLIEKQDNGMVNYRHILIKPKYTTEDKVDGFRKLDSIARLIKVDSITFEKAALAFSDDEQSRMGNGLLVNVRRYPAPPSPRFSKEELNPDDYRALKNLPNNEVSEPFETTNRQGNVVYKIIKVTQFIPAHTASLKEDYDMIYNVALQKKQYDAINKWIEKKRQTEYIRIDESFKDCDFEYKGWFK